ncbi:MAG: HAD-superfamily hydrolase [Paenibacillaceae bacterium]|jgi:putative hydrolase of the HAD superfamily|nr:HAD-superfamily hydrolase [Paenibacillaceae bacterium]
MKRKIEGILFDSGRVLNRPSTGHWYIPPRFFSIVDEKKFNTAGVKSVSYAFQRARTYLSKQDWVRDQEEEYTHFLEFYRIFSHALPQLGLTEESISLLASDMVYNAGKYRFYEDAVELIPVLSRRYRLGVVSDAWPSLDLVFREAGLRQYFSSFVISSETGVTKPHERMYQKALEELDLRPEEVIFVDDNPANCEGARELGIQSILLCRDWRLFLYHTFKSWGFPVVRNIKGVLKYIQ